MLHFIVGITGPTGSGKSFLCEYLHGTGLSVISADEAAREAMQKGSECLDELIAVFGEGIIKNGCLCRKRLAEIAFSSPHKTELLNKITHPHIMDIINKKIENCPSGIIILDAPTLFEAGAEKICDIVVAVTADENKRKKHILSRDSMTEEQADARINAGKPDSFYNKADVIIKNNGTDKELLEKGKLLFEQIKKKSQNKPL